MKAKLTLAEAATAHHDGTVSILRSGINRVTASGPPFYLQASLIVRIESDITDQGSHHLEVRCLGEDGQQSMPPVIGNFNVAESGGNTTLILGINTGFPKTGRYIFYVRVDNFALDEWAITVERPEVIDDKD